MHIFKLKNLFSLSPAQYRKHIMARANRLLGEIAKIGVASNPEQIALVKSLLHEVKGLLRQIGKNPDAYFHVVQAKALANQRRPVMLAKIDSLNKYYVARNTQLDNLQENKAVAPYKELLAQSLQYIPACSNGSIGQSSAVFIEYVMGRGTVRNTVKWLVPSNSPSPQLSLYKHTPNLLK